VWEGGLGLIFEGRSVDIETTMVSKIEEARIKREEKERRDDFPPPQFTYENIKSSLIQDKIDIVPPLTNKSDTSRQVESDNEEEEI